MSLDQFRNSALRMQPEASDTRQVRLALGFVMMALLGFLIGFSLVKVPWLFTAGAILAPLAVAAILRWPYVGLLLYIVIYITQIADLYPALKPLRPERLVGVVTLAALFLRQLREEGRIYIDRSPVTIWVLLLFGAIINSVPLAVWPGRAADGMVEFFKVVVFYVLVVQLIDTKTRLRTFMVLYTICMLYIAWDGIANYLAGNVRIKPDGSRLIGSTDVSGGPNQMAATMAATFPIFFLLAKLKALRWWRLVYGGGAILTTIVLVLTNSRSGMIGFLAGLALVWVSMKRRMVALVIGLPILAMAWFLMPSAYQARYATLSEPTEQGTARTRFELWTKAWLMFVDHPFTGVGINCYQIANPEYSERTGLDAEPYHASHSLYLQLLSNLGLPGLIAFAAFVVLAMRNLWRRIRWWREHDEWEFERVFLLGALIAMGALLVAGIFGHNLMRRQWYIFAAIGVAATRVWLTVEPTSNEATLGGRRGRQDIVERDRAPVLSWTAHQQQRR